MAEEEVRSRAVHRGRSFLACHLLFNALLITYVAINHTFTFNVDAASYWQGALRQHQVFIEALLLTLPGWVVGAAVAKLLPRTGVLLGALAITLAPVLYYGDLLSYLTLGSRLLSRNTWELIVSVLPLLSDYTTLSSYSSIVTAVIIWAVVEVISLLAGWNVSRLVAGGVGGRRRLVLAAALAVVVVPLACRLVHPRTVLSELRLHSERHPICAAGLIGYVRPEPPKSSPAERVRFQSHLLTRQAVLEKLRQRYLGLAVSDGPRHPHDVVLVVVESFRQDGLLPGSAPNLSHLADESIRGRWHFSGGNASDIGFFGLLFGLDSAFYCPATQDWPAALPKLLGEAGYYRAFLGSGPFEWREMNRFLNQGSFEFFRVDMTPSFFERDRKLTAQAVEILNRQGSFHDLQGRPVFLLLYLHTTHYPYDVAPEDEVFQPTVRGALPPPPWSTKVLPSIWNRYLNSVHTMDRLLKPILDPDRVIAVVGDHGEAFEEDGGTFHCTKLSFVQVRTPLVVHVPGGKPVDLRAPTSHADVLPTLLDAVAISVNHPEVFSGRSLLDPQRAAEFAPFSLRAFRGEGYALFGPYSRREDSTLMFHFGADLWRSRFGVIGAFDELARPVAASEQDVKAFDADVEVWLNRILCGESGKVARDPVPELVSVVEHDGLDSQRKAIEILTALGPNAKGAIPALEAYLRTHNGSPLIRKDIAEALVAIRSGG